MKIANILSLTLGAVLLLISIQWIFMPAVAAETLNMIYLEGEGRNTQIRDFTAFFLATSSMCFLSFATKKYEFIFSCGLVYMLAAVFNIFASISHEAPLALSSLVSEIVFTLMAWISAYKYKNL
tara:strand:+ start:126 stop:497 length:372 start_codon:yes stop_codon:yes gene_type:complete